MARNYDGIDLLWSNTGDFLLGHDGDIADTASDALLAVAQDVYDRCKSDLGDFTDAPLVGATISDFAGEPNSAENGQHLRQRIFTTLQSYGVLRAADISVDTYPVTLNQIAASVRLRTQATAENNGSRLIEHTFVYDYGENHVVPRG